MPVFQPCPGCRGRPQASGFAGSKAYADSARYNMIQRLPARASLGDGAEELSFGPDWTNPGRPHGLFRLTSC